MTVAFQLLVRHSSHGGSLLLRTDVMPAVPVHCLDCKSYAEKRAVQYSTVGNGVLSDGSGWCSALDIMTRASTACERFEPK